LFDEEICERYEYIPASIKVIEDVRRKYACDFNGKDGGQARAQTNEKGTAARAYWRT